MAHTTAKATGRTLHHMFAARLVAENGLIKLVRESLNVVAVAQALLPGGVKDLPIRRKRSSRSPRTTGAEAATLKYESMANRDRGADEPNLTREGLYEQRKSHRD